MGMGMDTSRRPRRPSRPTTPERVMMRGSPGMTAITNQTTMRTAGALPSANGPFPCRELLGPISAVAVAAQRPMSASWPCRSPFLSSGPPADCRVLSQVRAL
jgi:hypothetical protein